MKKKIILFIFSFFMFFSIANAEKIINYDWSFTNTNHNYGYGLNNILIINDNYFTWHLNKSTFNNVITEYDDSGNIINIYEPNIKDPIVDLIYYDNDYTAIDRQGTIYKLDKNFNIIKSISNPEKKTIINDKSELKISNNTIYYIDKTTFYIFSTDYQLNTYQSYNLENITSIEDILNHVPFLSQTDQMYFKYLLSIIDNEETIITDIQKQNEYYYITSITYNNDKIDSTCILIDENLNIIWQDNYSNTMPLNILIYKDYIFILTINTTTQIYSVKVYNSNHKFVNEEEIVLSDKSSIPISFVESEKGLLVKSLIYKADKVLTLDLTDISSEIVIDKYTINIFDIRKVIKGEGVIETSYNAINGDYIPIKVIAKEGYILDKLSIKDKYGNSIPLSDYTFKMPSSDVTITAIFIPRNPNTEDNICSLILIFFISLSTILISLYQYKRCKN